MIIIFNILMGICPIFGTQSGSRSPQADQEGINPPISSDRPLHLVKSDCKQINQTVNEEKKASVHEISLNNSKG